MYFPRLGPGPNFINPQNPRISDQDQTAADHFQPINSRSKGQCPPPPGQSTDVQQLFLLASKSPSCGCKSDRDTELWMRIQDISTVICISAFWWRIQLRSALTRTAVSKMKYWLLYKAAMQHYIHVDIYHFKSVYLDMFCSWMNGWKWSLSVS